MGNISNLPQGWRVAQHRKFLVRPNQIELSAEANLLRRLFFQKSNAYVRNEASYQNLDGASVEQIGYIPGVGLPTTFLCHPVPYGRHLESSVAQMPQPIGRYLCALTQQGRLWGDKERILMPEELGSTEEPFDLY